MWFRVKTIEIDVVDFSYDHANTINGAKAVDSITLSIAKGDFVVLAGRNGSGKSTLAKLCNALLQPGSGVVRVEGIDTRDRAGLREIRRRSGMIFQDPDSQIIGTTVAEDVAFGPENLGLDPQEIRKRVTEALRAVDLERHADRATHLLTAAQKLRLSLAGVLAMQPDCLLLDEAGAMLDPADRLEAMTLLRRLNREKGITVLQVTHSMEEAAAADRIILLEDGKIALDGTPAQVFSQASRIKEAGLDPPQVTELFSLLRQDGFELPEGILESDQAVEVFRKICYGEKNGDADQH